ncbi:MAG: TIGR04211 family SH3 domain-containing protein [Methylococcaceae bacterium]|nr:TIGR04211 family SH3 domain-containing protein [Methylococcaceae bacterium]
MKKITFIFLLLAISSLANAKTIYITDNVEVNLRAGETNKSKVLATLPSGTALTYISKRNKSNYIKVRMPNGRYAFILKRHTMDKPTNKVALANATAELEKITKENALLSAELAALKGDNTAAQTSNESLATEREQLAKELEDLRHTATHAIEIKEQRDTLQEQVVQANKELEQVKLENQTLEANTKLDWFLYGGTAIIFSVLLGFILPKLSWRKKSHNWDSGF